MASGIERDLEPMLNAVLPVHATKDLMGFAEEHSMAQGTATWLQNPLVVLGLLLLLALWLWIFHGLSPL